MEQADTPEQTTSATPNGTTLVDTQMLDNGVAAPESSTTDAPEAPNHEDTPSAASSRWHFIRSHLLTAAEVLVIIAWTCALTAPYLNLDINSVPSGREYLSAIQSHAFWAQMQACGMCAFWNGNVQGGAPALADFYSSMLHPVVMIPTLLFGVANGAKLALSGSFLLAGLAQWWLGHELALGRVARLWSAVMVVVGGHLAGRMDLGPPGLVLSTVACALVLPALLYLMRTQSWRAAVVLGITLAMAAVSGHGYLQVGLLFCMLAVLWIWPWDSAQSLLLLRRFALAGVMAFLLAAPMLIPVLHILPHITKTFSDAEFHSVQPVQYIPLNLVIADRDFFFTEALGRFPFPYLYTLYIGWIPLLLAVYGIYSSRTRDQQRMVALLLSFALIAIWVASAIPLRWLGASMPIEKLQELIMGMRHPPLIAGLAVPPLLALAGMGVDRLLRLNWPALRVAVKETAYPLAFSVSLRWVMVVPLVLALHSAWTFSSSWISSTRIGIEVDMLLEALETPDLQWVNAPMGEHFFTERATSMNLKLSDGFRTWHWRDHPSPLPMLEAGRSGPPMDMLEEPVQVVSGVGIYAAPPGREYAVVEHPNGGRTICRAYGMGGDIDVHCDLSEAGTLIVKEHNWAGWHATLAGRELPLSAEATWLVVDDVPAGEQVIELRYRPWDAWIGIGLAGLGIVIALAVWLWPGSASLRNMFSRQQHTGSE